MGASGLETESGATVWAPPDEQSGQSGEAIDIDDFLAELTSEGHEENIRSAQKSIGREMAAREGKDSLASLRLAKGLTQGQLAKALRTSQAYISRLECGEHAPGSDRVREIARALNIPAQKVWEALDA